MSDDNRAWSNAIGTKSRPVEILADGPCRNKDDTGGEESDILRAAFHGLSDGFGFVIGFHNLTISEYADMLSYLKPTTYDIVTGLSTLRTPFALEAVYKGPLENAQLIRLGSRRHNEHCSQLECMVVTQQHVLSLVC